MMFRMGVTGPAHLQCRPAVVSPAVVPRSVPCCRRPPALRPAAAVGAPGASDARKAGARKAPVQPDPVLPDSLLVKDTRVQTIPDDIVGPVAVSNGQGRRAVVATRNLTTGELLFITKPLVTINADDLYPDEGEAQAQAPEEGEEPQGKDPVKVMLEKLRANRYSLRQIELMKSLGKYPGGDSYPVDFAKIQQLDDTDKSLPLPPLSDEELEPVIRNNIFIAMSEDVPIAAMTDSAEGGQGIAGLWPHANLMSHSCAPNTVSYLAGGRQVTRASRPGVVRGGELTRGALPPILTTTLDQRREAIQEEKGFKCMCSRCVAEEAVPAELTSVIVSTKKALEELGDRVEQAMMDGDENQVNAAKDQIVNMIQTVDAALEQYKPAEQTQIWLQAGLFEMYEFLFTCLAASETYEPNLTEMLATLAGAVNPGGEPHVYWAYMHLRQVEEMCVLNTMEALKVEELSEEVVNAARKLDEFKSADQLCFKAHCARYGRITPQAYRAILDTIRTLEMSTQEAMAEGEGGEGEEEYEEEEGADDSNVVDIKSETVPPSQPKSS